MQFRKIMEKRLGKRLRFPEVKTYIRMEKICRKLFSNLPEKSLQYGAAQIQILKNAYADLVYYSQSFDNGKTWNKAEKLVHDTAGL